MIKELLSNPKASLQLALFILLLLLGYAFNSYITSTQEDATSAIRENTSVLSSLKSSVDTNNALLIRALGDKKTSSDLIEGIRQIALNNAIITTSTRQ